MSKRAAAVQESVIRKVFEEARDVVDPINLTLGQPDFPVPEPVKRAAIRAIEQDQNGYSSNRGIDPLLKKLAAKLKEDVGWEVSPTAKVNDNQSGLMVTGGTSGGLILAAMALLDPGDEIIIPDPYFVLYPRLGEMNGAKAVGCDTYPDFRLTAARVEPLITARTKAVVLNSPSNPCGVVSTEAECRELLELCRRRGVLLISDEIYDEFTYSEARTSGAAEHQLAGLDSGHRAMGVGDGPRVGGTGRCPSPCRFSGAQENCLLIRGFGKTYGFTGWRMGYASGPPALIDTMIKLQQHVYICAPTPLQAGAVAALDVDMSAQIAAYQKRRDMVVQRLSKVTDVPHPGGAFYAFVKVPERMKMTASEFKDLAKTKRVLVVPGRAFSGRDTHFRLSYAVEEKMLEKGVEALVAMIGGMNPQVMSVGR
jgi:aspartate/methionine/tyrosine aminotransferase